MTFYSSAAPLLVVFLGVVAAWACDRTCFRFLGASQMCNQIDGSFGVGSKVQAITGNTDLRYMANVRTIGFGLCGGFYLLTVLSGAGKILLVGG